MQMLPKDFLSLMLPFAMLFSKRVWQSVLVLVAGAILAPGKRTVSAILRGMELGQDTHFQTYHRALNRAVWSSRKAKQRQQRHQKLTDWARPRLFQVRRWRSEQDLIGVAESSVAASEFLAAVSQIAHPVDVITRLRIDAGWYEPPSTRQPKQMGRPRIKGKR